MIPNMAYDMDHVDIIVSELVKMIPMKMLIVITHLVVSLMVVDVVGYCHLVKDYHHMVIIIDAIGYNNAVMIMVGM